MPPAGAPSIRLSVGGSSSRSTTPPPNHPNNNNSTSAPPPSKKRRFVPNEKLQPLPANGNTFRLLHQKTALSIVLDQPTPTSKSCWQAKGTSALYLVDETKGETTPPSLALGLHFRGTCQVQSVTVESVSPKAPLALAPLSNPSYHHADPLERVLLKPPSSYTIDDVLQKAKRHEADSQSSRGAVGMTNSIRAASVASLLGELRITGTRPASPKQPPAVPVVEACWKQDLLQPLETASSVQRLQDRLNLRSPQLREKRLQSLVNTLVEAKDRALKVTVTYQILLGSPHETIHLGGIHASTCHRTPHIYTTAGVYGDHEGPRTWVPTLDSASTTHRASHQLSIQVTAPLREGVSVVGFGENFGASETLLHERLGKNDGTVGNSDDTDLVREFGGGHVKILREIQDKNNQQVDDLNLPHVIPPDPSVKALNMDSILATTVWVSNSWLPIPARSLGFAVGPFRVLEDPEYFCHEAEESTGKEAVLAQEHADHARDYGEGVRQAYFCPIFARKHIHVASANTTLLPNTRIQVTPLTQGEIKQLDELDECVLKVSSGVPNRALSLMRDILALPAFRTASYTQIWIPHAVHGGSTSGALHDCPEVLVNFFLGGSIMDARLLPPIGHRLPFHHGGRALQFLQARCAVRGWIISAIPLGGDDDVGQGYIHSLIEDLMMSMYERGHGAHGEGGALGGAYFTKRFAGGSGLNSSNLDFLPIQNIEEMDYDVVVGSVIGAVPVEDRNNDQLWRSASNGTESHTSAMDEFLVRQLLMMDVVSALERGNDKDRTVPTPSLGWMGSHLSLAFLTSNANSSAFLGCGALELVHPTGGLPYRALKAGVVRRIISARAGISNFIRLVRAAFIASHLHDSGEKKLKYPTDPPKNKNLDGDKEPEKEEYTRNLPRFIVCVNEILKKQGLTHTLFTRALQNICGRVREAQLLGTLVDVDRNSKDPRTNRPFVDPEGFPNSYVKGASELYLRVGVHVEPAKDTGSGISKGIQLQSYAEPVVPEGGISYGGPITIRVVENEGQFREFVKDVNADGSRRDWGNLTLHAKPVTTPKAQTAASGVIESTSTVKETKASSKADKSSSDGGSKLLASTTTSRGAFSENAIHRGGYQAIELIRLTNLTPLLWVRVDPMGQFCGRVSVFQPDACLAEMLFHDGDASAQVESLRALAERPLRIQGAVKVTSIYDVKVSELPVRVLGDCLRGSAALHSSLPHTPVVRAQAALAIAQWQNNKAPSTRNALSTNHWVGINLLIQYFRERFYNNGTVMPVKFNRVVLKKNEIENAQAAPSGDAATPNVVQATDDSYSYLDSFEEGAEREVVLEEADEVEIEEDEEYRVRSAVVTAIASIRAKDGMTPTAAIQFLETVLDAVDAEMVGNLVSPDEEVFFERKRRKTDNDEKNQEDDDSDDLADDVISSMPHVFGMLVADSLLALCHVNASPAVITDPTTGKPVQKSSNRLDHPVTKLMETSRRWLDWELYRENIRAELDENLHSGVSGACYDTIAACAITALSSLAILRQSTTDNPAAPTNPANSSESPETKKRLELLDEAATAPFYTSIFDHRPIRSDVTRAACAQAIGCVCCAADRFEVENKPPVGLLSALEFMLERIVEPTTSPGLRHTLAQLMLDSCSGKICSMQRVGAIGGRNDLITSAARFYNGPLGASHGGDNGGVAVTTVNSASYPAASAVNDGARRGLRLLSRAGHPRETGVGEDVVVRIAKFATNLWRTINGEPPSFEDTENHQFNGELGVCAYDGQLRCTLLALWQWCWPRGCFAVMQVQTWKSHETTQHYKDIGAHEVMKISPEEKEASNAEEASLAEITRLVKLEIDRQAWRGEMVTQAYEFNKSGKSGNLLDASATEQGLGQPLPPIQRDSAFKAGGWIASSAQQRRALALDGGTAVTKLRLRTSGD
eukprot:Nitzschia sp. Nitz4//scaffold39_size137210//1884//7601//NITZ4_003182-RA/size137210-processed-gene-0.81-mRNA-1//1//CDS//3329550332//8317//frame0